MEHKNEEAEQKNILILRSGCCPKKKKIVPVSWPKRKILDFCLSCIIGS